MQTRKGFTLVEMMVSLALIIFIMTLLAQAFSAAVGTFRSLKATGDLDATMRSSVTILRRDLAADHFEPGRRLSDPNFWNQPPLMGYLRIWHGSPIVYQTSVSPTLLSNPVNVWEGSSGNQLLGPLNSCRVTDHTLQMAVRLQGSRREDFFSADISGDVQNTAMGIVPSPLLTYYQDPTSRFQFFKLGTAGAPSQANFTSQWAEVAYFMRPSGKTTKSGIPLFNLHRREMLVVPNSDRLNYDSTRQSALWLAKGGTLPNPTYASSAYANISVKDKLAGEALANSGLSSGLAEVHFNSPADLTIPERRFGLRRDVAGGLPAISISSPQIDSRLNSPLQPPPPTGAPLFTLPRMEEAQPTNYMATGMVDTTGNFSPSQPSLTGSDIIQANVISFEVRFLMGDALSRRGARRVLDPSNNVLCDSDDPAYAGTVIKPVSFDPFVDLWDSQAYLPQATNISASPANAYRVKPVTDWLFNPATGSPDPDRVLDPQRDYVRDAFGTSFASSLAPRIFDTWSGVNDGVYNYASWNGTATTDNRVPLRIVILAIQVTIRTYDEKTLQTRQVTFVQNM